MVDWNAYRELFPAVSKMTYLNTAGGCALSVAAAAAGKQYFDEMLDGGDTHWSAWNARTEEVRCTLASLLHADPHDVAFVPNASLGMNLIARMLAEPGRRILAADKEFPSATLPWLNCGAEVAFVPLAQDGSVDLSHAEALLTPDATAFVASHVQYHTGYRYDLAVLRRFCDRHGLRLIVDATQSVGAYPVDVTSSRLDALVFSGYKWTTAGYGVGGLYVNRDLLETRPLPVVGWRSSRTPSDMVYDRLDLAPEGRALEAGHPPFPGIFALGAGLSLIQEIGVQRIAERVDGLTGLLHDGLRSRGYAIASPQTPAARSSITLVSMEHAGAIAERLYRHNVFVSSFEGKLRVSLHFYNDETDIAHFLNVLPVCVSEADHVIR